MRYFSLRQKFRIARIAFQEFFYIPELRLRIPDFRIHPLMVILQLCVIASDFNYNAPDPACTHAPRLLKTGIKKEHHRPAYRKTTDISADALCNIIFFRLQVAAPLSLQNL